MKKLMIVAAVALTGIAVNAAQVVWSVENCADPFTEEGTVNYAEGWAVYVFCNNADSPGSQSAVLRDNMIAALADGTYDLDKAISDVVYVSGGAEGGVGYNFGEGSDLTPNKVGVYAVLFNDADPNKATLAYVSTIEPTEIGSSGEGVVGFEMSGGADPSAWVEVAPEPTSGLLLLVGVAGLALRRRRA